MMRERVPAPFAVNFRGAGDAVWTVDERMTTAYRVLELTLQNYLGMLWSARSTH